MLCHNYDTINQGTLHFISIFYKEIKKTNENTTNVASTNRSEM